MSTRPSRSRVAVCWPRGVTISPVEVKVSALAATIESDACPSCVDPKSVVAVTRTLAGSGTAGGAMNTPAESTVPHVAPEQPAPETVQFTAFVWLDGNPAIDSGRLPPVATVPNAGTIAG